MFFVWGFTAPENWVTNNEFQSQGNIQLNSEHLKINVKTLSVFIS